MSKIAKPVPFGAHFSTRLEGIDHKLICALSATTSCADDARPTTGTSNGGVTHEDMWNGQT